MTTRAPAVLKSILKRSFQFQSLVFWRSVLKQIIRPNVDSVTFSLLSCTIVRRAGSSNQMRLTSCEKSQNFAFIKPTILECFALVISNQSIALFFLHMRRKFLKVFSFQCCLLYRSHHPLQSAPSLMPDSGSNHIFTNPSD